MSTRAGFFSVRSEVLPERSVLCGGHQESTWFFVSVTEGVRYTDRCFLQPLPAEAHAALGTLIRHEEAVDVLVTVTELDNALLIHLESREQLLCVWADPVSANTIPVEQRDLFAASLMFISASVWMIWLNSHVFFTNTNETCMILFYWCLAIMFYAVWSKSF